MKPKKIDKDSIRIASGKDLTAVIGTKDMSDVVRINRLIFNDTGFYMETYAIYRLWLWYSKSIGHVWAPLPDSDDDIKHAINKYIDNFLP